MAAATSVDQMLIAQDATFKLRVQMLLYDFCIVVIGGNTSQSTARKSYASQVCNNPNAFVNSFVLACAQDQNLSNSVITANGGANFTPNTIAATVASAVTTATPTTTGATDSLINNAIASAFNILANA